MQNRPHRHQSGFHLKAWNKKIYVGGPDPRGRCVKGGPEPCMPQLPSFVPASSGGAPRAPPLRGGAPWWCPCLPGELPPGPPGTSGWKHCIIFSLLRWKTSCTAPAVEPPRSQGALPGCSSHFSFIYVRGWAATHAFAMQTQDARAGGLPSQAEVSGKGLFPPTSPPMCSW